MDNEHRYSPRLGNTIKDRFTVGSLASLTSELAEKINDLHKTMGIE